MITQTKPECVFEGLCHLGEGPVWNVTEQRLYWTDIFNKRIWRYDPAQESSSLFWEGDHQVGGFAFTRSGGMILCTDRGVYLIEGRHLGRVHAEPQQLFDIPLQAGEAFNDITVDPCGRILAGTLHRGHTDGVLYRLERAEEPVPVLTDIGCSNGMTFSMDEKHLFHTDSGSKRITRYRYDVSCGDLSEPQVFFQGDESRGCPDGLTIDTEDHLWAAFWGCGAVCRLDPDGKIVDQISVPARQPSSVMFGGRDLNDLYITSACQDAVDLQTGFDGDGVFLGGPVYRCRSAVSGRPEWLADFD